MFQVDVTAADVLEGLNGGRIFRVESIQYTGHSTKPFRLTVQIINDAPGAEQWSPDFGDNPQD